MHSNHLSSPHPASSNDFLSPSTAADRGMPTVAPLLSSHFLLTQTATQPIRLSARHHTHTLLDSVFAASRATASTRRPTIASKLQMQSGPPSSIARFERARGWGVDDFWGERVDGGGACFGLWRGMWFGDLLSAASVESRGGSASSRVVSGAITSSPQ